MVCGVLEGLVLQHTKPIMAKRRIGDFVAARRASFRQRSKRVKGQWGLFFKGFIESPRMVGAILPSSHFTIRKVLAFVNWRECALFVEYGPGVGTFCQPVLDHLRPDGALIVIDTNPLFIDHLNKTILDPRFTAVLGSAADVEAIIQAKGHERADYVISGLPFSTLPEGVGPAIMAATHRVLRSGGAFIVYQYTRAARKLMEREFDTIDDAFELRNVPPCKIFCGEKP